VNKKSDFILQIDASNPDPRVIEKAADIVRQGGLVVFPTETVYGIAVMYGNSKAVERLYRVKRRKPDKPLTVHISSSSSIDSYGCIISDNARILMNRYWPGPLTLVLPLLSGEGTLGFRLPDHPVALALIDAVGGGVFAPSANLSGSKSPVTAGEAYEQFGNEIDMYIDAGKTGYGKDSTVIDMTGDKPVILREGALSKDVVFSAIL
jgi:L-threonylcarbamoyladenylate synthase